MITYKDIYEALRKEKHSEALQPLGKNFVEDVAEYLQDKKEISEKKDDMFSDAITKTKKQFENTITIFKELMTRRKKKLLSLAFVARETGISKKDFENMFNFEKEMFDRIVKSMENSDKKVSSLLNGKKEEKQESDKNMVSFKKNVEKFLGPEGKEIGPFQKGDLANIPKNIVEILKKNDSVEEVEEN